MVVIDLPPAIPSACVESAARDYEIPPLMILAVMKHESGGRTGVVGKNGNGTVDVGPMQFNLGSSRSSWVQHFYSNYGITPESLLNDMCQAIRAGAYAIKMESRRRACGGDLWCGIAYYHSPTAKFQWVYVQKVQRALDAMVRSGRF